jgi:hypothetical protein
MTKTLPTIALLIALALPASAAARIVPQRGIAGATLNMTRAELQSKRGAPDKSLVRDSQVFGRYETWFYGKTSIDMFRKGDDKVFNMSTTDRSERTATDVGVGSTAAAVKKGVTGVRCDSSHCFLGRFDPGRKVTDFILSKTGRVTRVTIGYVFD